MPKLKTRKAVAKRVRITKKGRVKKTKAGSGHLLSSKSRKRKRHLKKRDLVTKIDAAKIRLMVPYGTN